MWTTTFNILKVALPILMQVIGWWLTAHGAKQNGLLTSGQFTTEEVGPALFGDIGNIAVGAILSASGLAAILLIHHREKKTATAALPPNPIAGAIDDAMLHAVATEAFTIATSPDSDEAERNYIFEEVNLRRKHLDEKKKVTA